jgi:hypothetical protein
VNQKPNTMKKMKTCIFVFTTILLVAFISPPEGPDPAYFKAFGYGSIAVSIGGRPSYNKYDPAQFDYQNGIFYVKAGADRLDLRALLPQGQTYESMMNDLFKTKSDLLKDKKDDGSIYWYAWSSHDYDGTRKYPEWKPGSPHPDYHDKAVWTSSLNFEPAKTWISSAVYFDDTEEDSFKVDVINTWMKYAKPGWQLYILNTVGFQRWVKEASYWDYGQGKQVTPLEFVMSDKEYAYCIIQIK